MTPKEKATDLLDKFYQAAPSATTWNPIESNKEVAKQAALICVDEILTIDAAGYRVSVDRDMDNDIYIGFRDYWQEVKEEIEKL